MVISLVGVKRRWALVAAILVWIFYTPWLLRTLIPFRNEGTPSMVVSQFSVSGRWMALAFADIPEDQTGRAIVADLAMHRVRATFFVTGQSTVRFKGWMRLGRRRGDDIENHSQAHINLAVHPLRQDVADLQKAQAAIKSAVGSRPRWLLPPYGAVNSTVIDAAHAVHLRVVHPHFDDVVAVGGLTGQAIMSRQAMIHHVMEDLRPGAIVVLEGMNGKTASGIPRLLSLIALKGYHVVSIPTLWRRSR